MKSSEDLSCLLVAYTVPIHLDHQTANALC